LGRVAWDPSTRAYIKRKQAEGKTKLEAIRCLKRHIARQIYNLLYTTQPATPTPPKPTPTPITATVPAFMPCIR
jgi:hypothetical protein